MYPGRHQSPIPVAALLAVATALATSSARAEDPLCSSLPNPVYGLGGSAQKPLIANVAATLRKLDDPLTVVYSAPGACFGIYALKDGTPMTGTANYWDADGKEHNCRLPELGQEAEYAVMGIFPDSCAGVDETPADIGDFEVSIGTFNLIVPVSSSQQSISSEGLYFVYGFGELGQVEPWTDDSQIFSRDYTSAAAVLIAKAAGMPVEKIKGLDVRTNQRMVTELRSATNPEAAIGFVSGEVADQNREFVKTLAFQAKGQRCAFWPDSEPGKLDKRSVREGKYHIWSSSHFFAKIDSERQIVNERARRFIGFLTGEITDPLVPILDIYIDIGNIPQCAMEVARSGDLGPIFPYLPERPCGCYFEKRVTGETSCETCTNDDDCATGACRYGFCEAR